MTRNILKKTYHEVAEGIFDMSNVRIFKEIEKQKWGMFILCYVSGQLSSVKRFSQGTSILLQNICSDLSMVQDGAGLLESRENSSQMKQYMRCVQMLHI